MENEGKQFLVKDFINNDVIYSLNERLVSSYSDFDGQGFTNSVISKLPELEYKERIDWIAINLRKYLPEDYETALTILNNSLLEELPNKEEIRVNRFYIVAYNKFVSDYGLAHFDISMNSLLLQTKCFTSEFGIRAFINEYQSESFALLKKWAVSDNMHVRRLCSEGCRPRLPWAMQLKKLIANPVPILELLELLKNDDELYVRRSVANNLNDISKDYPYLVINTLKFWKNGTKNMDWLISHALRTLIKKGNSEALALIGYKANPDIEINNFKFERNSCRIGEDVYFSFELISMEKQLLMIDYSVIFLKANGSTSSKIFKLVKREFSENETVSFKKKQSFKHYTTRTIYPGIHFIELQINGERFGKIEIEVKE